ARAGRRLPGGRPAMTLSRRAMTLGALAWAAARAAQAQPAKFVDSVGRSVDVPGNLAKVMPAGPPASILLYALEPEKLIGWVPGLQNEAKPFVLPAARELPPIPRLTARNQTVEADAIKALKPDLIVDFGSIGPSYVALADSVQRQT